VVKKRAEVKRQKEEEKSEKAKVKTKKQNPILL